MRLHRVRSITFGRSGPIGRGGVPGHRIQQMHDIMANPDIYLHHYERSPFAEKIRVAFGLKRVAWRSVLQPRIAPKPDLVALTGGYRRIPVMQIGADIFCDTRCILDALDMRFAEPTLIPNEARGLSRMIEAFADRFMFATTLGLLFGRFGDQFPDALHADRVAFTQGRFAGWDPEAMRVRMASLPMHLAEYLSWLDSALAGSQSFLATDQPTVADLAAYHPLWYARQNLPPEWSDFGKWSHVDSWYRRLEAVGHGARQEADAGEAHDVARRCSPADWSMHPLARGFATDAASSMIGQTVSVQPDDWGFDPVVGMLVSCDSRALVVARDEPGLGIIHVHFPHIGFVVRPVDTAQDAPGNG